MSSCSVRENLRRGALKGKTTSKKGKQGNRGKKTFDTADIQKDQTLRRGGDGGRQTEGFPPGLVEGKKIPQKSVNKKGDAAPETDERKRRRKKRDFS